MLHWMNPSPCKSFACSLTSCQRFVSQFLCLYHRNANHYLKIVAFCTLYSVHFMTTCSAFPLTTPVIWTAILLYDYCLTFVAEVERCWAVRRLSWGLVFFYLNHYLVLFGHIPIMLEFFWSTSNPKKVEVGILLLKSPCTEARWKDTDAQPLRCWSIHL